MIGVSFPVAVALIPAGLTVVVCAAGRVVWWLSGRPWVRESC